LDELLATIYRERKQFEASGDNGAQ
jgi:hypothetical protein